MHFILQNTNVIEITIFKKFSSRLSKKWIKLEARPQNTFKLRTDMGQILDDVHLASWLNTLNVTLDFLAFDEAQVIKVLLTNLV